MWCWELKWEQRSSSQPEKLNALQRDTVNLSPHIYYRPFVLWKSQGSEIIGNSLKEGGSADTKSVIFEHGGHQCLPSDKTVRGVESLSVQPKELQFYVVTDQEQWLKFPVPLLLFQLLSSFGGLKIIMRRLCSWRQKWSLIMTSRVFVNTPTSRCLCNPSVFKTSSSSCLRNRGRLLENQQMVT